jgi:hypothetical protein
MYHFYPNRHIGNSGFLVNLVVMRKQVIKSHLGTLGYVAEPVGPRSVEAGLVRPLKLPLEVYFAQWLRANPGWNFGYGTAVQHPKHDFKEILRGKISPKFLKNHRIGFGQPQFDLLVRVLRIVSHHFKTIRMVFYQTNRSKFRKGSCFRLRITRFPFSNISDLTQIV